MVLELVQVADGGGGSSGVGISRCWGSSREVYVLLARSSRPNSEVGDGDSRFCVGC